MDYQQAVTEAKVLVRRSEEDQWRLAQLSWENTRPQGPHTQKEWAADVGLSNQRVSVLARAWEKYGVDHSYQVGAITFGDACMEVQGLPADRAERREMEATARLRKMAPERKTEVVRELLDDEEISISGRARIADRLLADPKVRDQVLARLPRPSEADLAAAAERSPLRDAPLGAPLGFAQMTADVRRLLREMHDLAANARVQWEGFRAPAAEELRQIARQAELLAELVENPTFMNVTDEELAKLLEEE